MTDSTTGDRSPGRIIYEIAISLIVVGVIVWDHRRGLGVAGIWVFASGLLLWFPARYSAGSEKTRSGLFGASVALLVVGLILFIFNR
ncbi:MAG: hypothetical protein ABSD59_12690 [Terracidiphilus sp.]|jgi:hypothetical protein